jgi:membrane protein required for colicin V production
MGLSATAIDILVVVVILVSAAYAGFRGLVHETFAILEWVAAGYVALRFTPLFQPLLRDYISPAWLEWIAVFAGTFLIVFIPLSIMSHRVSEQVKKSEIGPIDRTLGVVFGFGRGLVIVGFAYIAFAALVPVRDHPDTLTKARLFPLIRNTSDVLRSLTPQEAKGAAGTDAPADAKSPPPRSTPAKTYGADDRSALDRLFQTNGGDGPPRDDHPIRR